MTTIATFHWVIYLTDIRPVFLVRLGSDTHVVSTDQRRVPLVLKRSALLRKPTPKAVRRNSH